jgi:hypothetical protein
MSTRDRQASSPPTVDLGTDRTIELLRKKMNSSRIQQISRELKTVGRDSINVDSSTRLDVTSPALQREKDVADPVRHVIHRIYARENSTYKTGWLLNRFAKKCMNSSCQRAFGLTTRKHHCRKCGDIFCSTCTQNTLHVRGLQEAPEGSKVCASCFESNPPSEKLGNLARKNNMISEWAKKYCVLQEGVLSYYETEIDYLSNKPRSGALNIFDFTVVPDVTDEPMAISLTSGDNWMTKTTMVFRCETQQARQNWIASLEQHIVWVRRFGTPTSGVDDVPEPFHNTVQGKVNSFLSNVFGASVDVISSTVKLPRTNSPPPAHPVEVSSIVEHESVVSDGLLEFAKDKNCKHCQVKFSILGPARHHCRRCGSSVCDGCSPKKGLIQSIGEEAHVERVCIDCEDAAELPRDKEGWVVKQGHSSGKWQKRYFVLTQGKITYFESQGKRVKGTIDLKQFRLSATDQEADISSGGYNFILTNVDPWARAYLLSVSSLEERIHWLEALSKHIDFYTSQHAHPSSPDSRKTLPSTKSLPPTKEGWLMKEGHTFRSWKKRFFTLSEGCLSYYTSQGKGLKGSINLVNYLVSDGGSSDPTDSGMFLFLLADTRPQGKSYKICAATAEERSLWIIALQEHINFYANGIVATPAAATAPTSSSTSTFTSPICEYTNDLDPFITFLQSGESILQYGKVVKKGLGVVPINDPDHMLILTNKKRLFFVDLGSYKLKGTVELKSADTTCTKVKNFLKT